MKKLKIVFLQSPSCEPYNLGYFIGDEAEIEEAVARDLIFQGMAREVDIPENTHAKSEKATSKAAAAAEKR